MPASSDPREPASWPSDLSAAFQELPGSRRWWVALSGGCDSIFLLYCLTALAPRHNAALNAVHLHHGLNAEADQWQKHCERVCAAIGVPLTTRELALAPGQPDLEARARQARYDCFEALLEPGDLLFMAHHGDDQAETVLLRLLRGSGVRGLAGMPAQRELGQGQLARPLLGLERARIEALSREWGLAWCEDGSNRDTRFDRNYLRHEVMPVLEARWPRSGPRIARSAEHCRQAERLLGELADRDAREVASGQGISVSALDDLDEARRQQLLRHLLIRQGYQPPGERRLASGMDALLHAPDDARPELRGEGYRVCRYQDRLWLVPELPEPDVGAVAQWHPGTSLDWFGSRLSADACVGAGIAAASDDWFTLRLLARGERFRPGPNQPRRPLRQWLQEHRVPPWERTRLPLIVHGETLVAIADLWVAPQWRAAEGEAGWQPNWHRPWRLLQAVAEGSRAPT
ncbi:tRNA lysidine(34) synthetase TilS [Halomonadaceae bacterium KBTZ08]